MFKICLKAMFVVVQGSGFLHGHELKDLSVTIGEEACNITGVWVNSIHCTPPAQQPPQDKYHIDGNPRVLVRAGIVNVYCG